MGTKRVVWHVGFERNLRRRGSRAFEIHAEVPLSSEPPRIDYLLIRKIAVELDEPAETLRRLWPMLPRVSIVEYKSPGRGYRAGNLDRLWSYVHTYYADQRDLPRTRADGTALVRGMPGAADVWEREDLCAVLVVPNRSESLIADVNAQGLTWVDLGDGYWRVTGGGCVLYVVDIEKVGPAEHDDLLCLLGDGRERWITEEVREFWAELVGSKEAGTSMKNTEGYDDLMRKLLAGLSPEQRLAGLSPEQILASFAPEQRLAGLPPEQRLAGLAPEQRLAGLDRDHQALALPDEVLRALPESYLASLAPEIQAEIRRRLQQRDH